MGSSSVSPTLKEVVEMLLNKDGEETKTVPSRNNPSTRRDVTFLIYKCPRDRLCTTKGVFKFEKGTGYSNPFHHLRRCLAGGSKDDLLRMNYAAKYERRRNSAFPTQHISASAHTPTHGGEYDDDSLHELKLAINRNKKRRVDGKESGYINADFVLGPMAEIERVWSISKYLLPNKRKKMEPVVFEALLFLKVNRGYWNIKSVQAAIIQCRDEDSSI